jgi:RHS repeat-associated protein
VGAGVVSLSLYKPWGESRGGAGTTLTDYGYTGQRKNSYIKLTWFGSRWYDDSLGRFTQPDSIIPEASQGVLAWDRYAYVNNSPINHNDPSGHCFPVCTAIGGAIIGGIVGGLAYTIATGSKANFAEGLLAVGVGAAGGALIGTGVGAGAGATLMSSVLIGAGTGVVGTQLAYTLTAGENYNSTEMVIDSAVGGITGAISGGASNSLSPTTASVVKLGLDAYTGVAQYQAHAMVNGVMPDPGKELQSAITGAASGFVGRGLLPDVKLGKVPDPATKVFFETAIDAGKTTAIQGLQDYLDSGFPDAQEQEWDFSGE